MQVLNDSTRLGGNGSPTWSEKELKLQMEIWPDEDLAQLLVTTHKKSKGFKLIRSSPHSPIEPSPQSNRVYRTNRSENDLSWSTLCPLCFSFGVFGSICLVDNKNIVFTNWDLFWNQPFTLGPVPYLCAVEFWPTQSARCVGLPAHTEHSGSTLMTDNAVYRSGQLLIKYCNSVQ